MDIPGTVRLGRTEAVWAEINQCWKVVLGFSTLKGEEVTIAMMRIVAGELLLIFREH